MENIFLCRDGRYEERLTDGKSCEKVEKKIQNFKENQSYSEAGLTVKNFFWEWLEFSKLRLKESTISNYISKAEAHILSIFVNR